MKPGLAMQPLDVWEQLLHKSEKQSLSYLKIYKRTPKKQENPQREAFLAVTDRGEQQYGCFRRCQTYKDCDFPEAEMPENIKKFKQLEISHLDDDVLDFLQKIRSLFTNVLIRIETSREQEIGNVCILLGQLLPMLHSIRAIRNISYKNNNNIVEWLEREFPGTLARAQELDVRAAEPVSIPFYLDWLNTPRQDHHRGPRFLVFNTNATTAAAMVDAVRKNILAATSPATFVIFIKLALVDRTGQKYHRPDEFNIENATTNEQLVLRNAAAKKPPGCFNTSDIPYVEILRHPTGAEANVREWLKRRAYWEMWSSYYDREERVITIKGKSLTIGPDNDKKDEDGYIEEFEVGGPSTSAKIMKKMVDKDNEEKKWMNG